VEVRSGGDVVVCNSVYAFGVLQNQPKSGEAATIAVEGFTKALANAAIYPGQYVKNSSGWCAIVTTGDALSTLVVLGRALTGAASGGQFTLDLRKQLIITSGSALP
jgi:hypothetical protein